MSHFRAGRLDEAAATYREALRLGSNATANWISVVGWLNLAQVLIAQGRGREALSCQEKALALDAGAWKVHSQRCLTLQYLGGVPASESLAAHRTFARQCEAPLVGTRRPHNRDRDIGRRLRIGYLSPDFRRHSVAYFIEPVFAHHRRSEVEIHAYYNYNYPDDWTERLRGLSDAWMECSQLTDEELSERIRTDGIDILVDLAGHTEGNRLGVFARKPSPVQVTYLGYPGTTGLEAMDYRICSWETDPQGQEAYHSEQLYRLGRPMWCYRPEPQAGEGSAVSRTAGAVVFGSLNNYAKVSPEAFARWMEILRAVPGSRLVMTSVPQGSVREELAKRVEASGLEPERVIAHGRLPAQEYRALLRRIDVALDPYPYNGTTTTCETLGSGIPVVSLIGDRSVSRSGYALLKAVGLGELAARDEAEYVAIAVGLARDEVRLRELRRELPSRFEGSSLRDEAGFVRELESAYREMWRRWCAGGGGPG
jgi:predicted O-linked N-acetylglucosamine transferase (SPINDLY family)